MRALAGGAGAGVPVHWMLPGDDPALAGLALAGSLAGVHGGAFGGPGALAAQRLGEVAGWDVVRASAAALPALAAVYGAGAPGALLVAGGSLAGLARAGAADMAAWCGGDEVLAARLLDFFGAASD